MHVGDLSIVAPDALHVAVVCDDCPWCACVRACAGV